MNIKTIKRLNSIIFKSYFAAALVTFGTGALSFATTPEELESFSEDCHERSSQIYTCVMNCTSDTREQILKINVPFFECVCSICPPVEEESLRDRSDFHVKRANTRQRLCPFRVRHDNSRSSYETVRMKVAYGLGNCLCATSKASIYGLVAPTLICYPVLGLARVPVAGLAACPCKLAAYYADCRLCCSTRPGPEEEVMPLAEP